MARKVIVGGKVYEATSTRKIIVGGKIYEETVVVAPTGNKPRQLTLMGVG